MNKNKKSTTALIFVSFIILASLIVILLEYIDHKKNGDSLIFDKFLKKDKQQISYSDPKTYTAILRNIVTENQITFATFRDEKEIIHFKIEIGSERFGSFFSIVEDQTQKAGGRLSLIEKETLLNKSVLLYHVNFSSKLTHVLLVTKISSKETPEVAEKEKAPAQQPGAIASVALVIDDLGYNDNFSSQLKELNIPITAAVIPQAPFADVEAERLKSWGIEHIIHLPMESTSSDFEHPKDEFILVNSTRKEIQTLLRQARETLPHAKGVNNHMGSAVTRNKSVMEVFLEILKDEDLYFLDSRTSVYTIAYQTARELGVKTVNRDLFLDSETQTYEYTSAQIDKLITMALERGRAVAIGHAYESTIRAIRDAIPKIRSAGIKIVSVSNLLE